MARLQESRTPDGRLLGYMFVCPGCGQWHDLCTTDEPENRGHRWEFDGDIDRPTFKPSLLVQWGKDFESRCHSYVRDGRIQFLSDCTHALAGQTVDLPEIEA